jgi:hypothetical protein
MVFLNYVSVQCEKAFQQAVVGYPAGKSVISYRPLRFIYQPGKYSGRILPRQLSLPYCSLLIPGGKIEERFRCNCSICTRKGALMTTQVVPAEQFEFQAQAGALCVTASLTWMKYSVKTIRYNLCRLPIIFSSGTESMRTADVSDMCCDNWWNDRLKWVTRTFIKA